MEKTRDFQLIWKKYKTFIVLLASYVVAVIILFILGMKGKPLDPYPGKAGLGEQCQFKT